MPRNPACRRIQGGFAPATTCDKADNCHLCCTRRKGGAAVQLGLDELEALRLADLEGLYQEAAARSMGISRQTFGRIIEAARKKVALALIERRPIRIEEGQHIAVKEKEKMKKIALPTKEGMIDAHFGHCAYFTVYETEGSAIISEKRVDSPQGCGCKSNIASALAADGVSLMIAGNMGDGAVRVLSAQGIEVIRGIGGSTREAVEEWLRGTLADSGEACAAHGHDCSH